MLLASIVLHSLVGLTVVTGSAINAWLWFKVKDGGLPRNPKVGIRTTATMRDDGAWLRGNRAGARVGLWALPWGALCLAGIVIQFALAPTDIGLGVLLLLLAVWLLGYLVITVCIVLSANRAANATDVPEDD